MNDQGVDVFKDMHGGIQLCTIMHSMYYIFYYGVKNGMHELHRFCQGIV